MFTGLIEEIGTIKNTRRQNGAVCFSIEAEEVLRELNIDDSISIQGVCLTVTKIAAPTFEVQAVEETLRKTKLGQLKIGSRVNLERAVRAADRMGGHFVQGHVDDVGTISRIQQQEGGILLSITIPPHLMKYIISEGSITIDGVSLTVARLQENEITISLIPHTLDKTTLSDLQMRDQVNIEVDILGKYIENLLSKSDSSKISEPWLEQMGYKIN